MRVHVVDNAEEVQEPKTDTEAPKAKENCAVEQRENRAPGASGMAMGAPNWLQSLRCPSDGPHRGCFPEGPLSRAPKGWQDG